jgi:hypothetical protein
MIIPVFTSRAAVERYARETVGGLGDPSKMPGLAYGLPPRKCRVGRKLAKLTGTPCSKCYACKGRYTATDGHGNPGTVARAQENRLRALESNLAEWSDSFVVILRALSPSTADRDKFFRWHDAGDVQSVEHLQAICDIATRCPDWHFWLPTQEHGDVRKFLAAGGRIPENLTIRESSPRLGQRITGTVGCTSYVEPDRAKFRASADRCRAYETGGKCGDCRRCWQRSVPVVIYPEH